ncbi:hypothetical protein F4802DRAFT_591209 [Xylaria palmicola]|nr:hypothetical protein F4802DRAFT_591209 [Xylaria palmicola]
MPAPSIAMEDCPGIAIKAPPDPAPDGAALSKITSKEPTGHHATLDTAQPPPSDEINTPPQTPHGKRNPWSVSRRESRLFSLAPWPERPHHTPPKERVLYELARRPILEEDIRAEGEGIYSGYLLVESKCREVHEAQAANHTRHDIDVISYLEAIPCSVLVQLQSGGVDPEDIVRSALQSSLEGLKQLVEKHKNSHFMESPFLDGHIPTIKEGLYGFLAAQKCRAAAPDRQDTGAQGRTQVPANTLKVGYDVLNAIDEAAEQAQRNIAKRAENEKTMEATSKAEEEAKTKAEKEAKQHVVHKVYKCCGTPLCTNQLVIRDDKTSLSYQGPLQVPVIPSILPDTRPLNDTSSYKQIGKHYYMCVDGKWMNTSLTNNQYQALTNLYITGINEFYDFFAMLYYPKTPPLFRNLGAQYSMFTRLRDHIIYGLLDVLRVRLSEGLEHMVRFILYAYSMMQNLGELIHNNRQILPVYISQRDSTSKDLHSARGADERRYDAIELHADLARYRSCIENEDTYKQLHWQRVAINQYDQALHLDPTVGRYYYHIGFLSRKYVSRFFNLLKALTVNKPYMMAWDTLLSTLISKFVASESTAAVVSLEMSNVYTAISSLLLALAPAEYVQKHRFETRKETHLLAFDKTLQLIASFDDPQTSRSMVYWNPALVRNKLLKPSIRPAISAQGSPIRPSARLALILCQLLLLDKTNKAARLVWVINLRILANPATYVLRLWEYIHILVVFLRSFNTQPGVKEDISDAFHLDLMVPLLNLLLRRIRSRGGYAWEALFRPEFPTCKAYLNSEHKLGKYGISTTDAQKNYLHCKKEQEAEGAKPDNVLAISTEDITKTQGTTFKHIGFEDNTSLDGLVQEQKYTLVLPEDHLLRGFSFAKQSPPPLEPVEPLTEQQIARAQWEKEDARIAQLQRDKKSRKQQKRIARGADSKPHRHTCLDCRILAKSRRSKKNKRLAAHAATSDACQECCGCHRVDTITTSQESPTTTLNTVVEAIEARCENDIKDAPANVAKDDATLADTTATTSEDTQFADWVVIGTVEAVVNDKTIVNTADVVSKETSTNLYSTQAVVKEVTDASPQQLENSVVDSDNPDSDEPSDLGLLFSEADSIPSVVTQPEADYGISGMFTQADAEADKAEALRLEPYFYPPSFFENSKFDREDFMACHDYVQSTDVTDYRELRILWAAVWGGGFSIQGENEGYVISVPGQNSAPQIYTDAQMPAVITRNDGSRVVYVDPTAAERAAEMDNLWEKDAKDDNRKRNKHDNNQGENGVQDVEGVEEWCSMCCEPPTEVPTITDQDAGVVDEPLNPFPSLPRPDGGVAQLTHATVAALSLQDEDVDSP